MATHKKQQTIVFGANGQVGASLRNYLAADRTIFRTHETCDLTNHEHVTDMLATTQPRAVINVTGFNREPGSPAEVHECWQVNVAAVSNLVRTCLLYDIPLIHLSTDQVFGMDAERTKPYTEVDPVGPVNKLGVSKLAGEHAILSSVQGACPEYAGRAFRYFIVRTSLPYEIPWRLHSNLVNGMVQGITGNPRSKPINVPALVRSPTFVPYLAKSLAWLADNSSNVVSGIYHIACTGSVNLVHFCRTLSNMLRSRGADIVATPTSLYQALYGMTQDELPYYTALSSKKWLEIAPFQLPSWEEALGEFASAYNKL